jgi:hypothetical protein
VAVRYLAPSFVFYHLGACVASFALFDRVVSTLRKVGTLERFGPKLAQAAFAVPVLLRLAEFPNGYGAGEDYYAGLQRYYLDHLERDTGFVSFVGYFGHLIFDLDYKLNRKVIPLESFRPLRGVKRYLVVEIHTGPRQDELETLLKEHFGLSAKHWHALPLVHLPHTLYQPAVTARLVELDELPKKPSHRHRAARN